MLNDDVHDGRIVNHNALPWHPRARAFALPLFSLVYVVWLFIRVQSRVGFFSDIFHLLLDRSSCLASFSCLSFRIGLLFLDVCNVLDLSQELAQAVLCG